MPQDDAACKKRKDSLNGEKDGSFVALFNELRGTKEEGSTRRRTFGPLSGHPRRPAESTMPRRRPSLFAVGHEAGGGCETSGLGGPHLGGEKLTSKVVDAQEGVNKNNGPIGTSEGPDLFRIAWGLPRKKPMAIDLPQRSSGYLFNSSHVLDTAAEVSSHRDRSFPAGEARNVDSYDDTAAEPAHFLATGKTM
ncbi:unnamed protein product [Ectocarpus fasciculatus]